MNDQAYIEQLKKGDNEAFRQLLATWQDMVYNTSLGILQNAEDAEDVTQEVFVTVYESVSQFKGDSKLSTWLYRIAVTKSLDHIRKKKRKKRFAFVQSLFGAGAEEIHERPDFQHPGIKLENRERAVVLFRAVGKLPENQKIAFTLHKLEGLSYQEVAEIMETSVSSVESLMHRAKTNLRKLLENYYQNINQ